MAKIWDMQTAQLSGQLSGHEAEIYSVAVFPDGQQVITGSGDETAIIWNADNLKKRVICTGHKHFVNGVAAFPDGSKVITCSSDCTAKIWDAYSARIMATLEGSTRGPSVGVNCVAVSPDGQK